MQILKVIQNHGYTLEQVATMLGITKGSLSATINGSPNVKKLIDIALKIGCSPAEFFDDWYENEGKAQERPAEQGRPSPIPSPLGRGVDAAEQLDDAEDWLPRTATTPEKVVCKQGLVCPHCGRPFAIEVKGI